jgi:hypothetical protein
MINPQWSVMVQDHFVHGVCAVCGQYRGASIHEQVIYKVKGRHAYIPHPNHKWKLARDVPWLSDPQSYHFVCVCHAFISVDKDVFWGRKAYVPEIDPEWIFNN